MASVSLRDLSLFRSNIALFTAGAALAITVIPAALAVSKIAVVAGIAIAAIAYRHRLLYDISTIYNALVQKNWWHRVSDDVLLSAIPLVQHIPQLKEEGITHVITIVEDFELERGMVHPVTPELWRQHGIEQLQARVQDRTAVPPETLRKIANYIARVRRENADAKFLVHCKAGRGRSATVVVADQLTQKNGSVEDIPEECRSLKAIRPYVHVNEKQQKSLYQYIKNLSR